MSLRDVGKGESKLKRLIPTVAGYFRKAAFNATGDQVKAEKVGQLIESQLANMPDDVAEAYVKSAMDKLGMGLRFNPDESWSYSYYENGVPYITISPYQVFDDNGNISRTETIIHELGHDTDAKMRNKAPERMGVGAIPMSIQKDLGYWMGRDLQQGKGFPKNMKPGNFGISSIDDPSFEGKRDTYAVEGPYYDQMALSPDMKGFYPGFLRWSSAGGHFASYPSDMHESAKEADPSNFSSSKEAKTRAAQSLEAFANLGALYGDTELGKNYGTTPEELWPSGTKAFRSMISQDPRRSGIDFIEPDSVLQKYKRTKAVPMLDFSRADDVEIDEYPYGVPLHEGGYTTKR